LIQDLPCWHLAASAAAAAAGLILTPLMLELGVHPAVSVASSQITMLIGNSTSAIVYAVSCITDSK
jgi:uncharacterized membrane protein YfcA